MSPSVVPNPAVAYGVADPSHDRRRKRVVEGSDEHRVPRNAHTGALPRMNITWRDGSANVFGIPIPRPLSEGPVESRTQAVEAATHLRTFDAWMRERWNRAGWDDKGGDLTVVVNQKGMGGNAYFAYGEARGTGEMGIGVKDARIGFKKSPAYSPSILFHEYVHGIVGSELRHMPKKVQPYLDHREHRGINESIADVISTGLLDTGWQNGQEIRDGAPLRDLADPAVPTWNAAVRKDGGLEEHTISGVISRAAVVAAESAGTLPVVDAWYAGIDRFYREELMKVEQPGAGRALGAWVRATMRGATLVGGAGGALSEAMRAGWEAVGLGRYASDAQLARNGSPRKRAGAAAARGA